MELFSGFDLESFIRAAGYLGLFAIVFAESGLFFGFFLPGDSLLFTAGFLASQSFFDIWLIVLVCFLGAVLGDNVGYAFGRRVGPKIFTREDSFLFRKQNLMRAKNFYDKYGGKTIVFARFIPVIRTFAPILAGVGTMGYSKFLWWNLFGGALWGVGLPLAGFYLGNAVPNADRYLLPIIASIILISVLPPLVNLFRAYDWRAAIKRCFARKGA